MKTKLLLIFISFTLSCCCHAQHEIARIDSSVHKIQSKLASYTEIEKMKSEQGIRSAFFENKNLQLIRVKAMDGALEKTTEWYYTDGQLVYCETNWYNPETKTNIFTEKCYLHKRHLIYWSNSRDKTIPSSSDAFKKMDAELFVYGEKIKAEALK